ncbi:hypothetical protein EVAR_42034_1 [Eumeta japonica]|uniref:Uncharacterized protein n=1 Tax=Eumeta variegata TaxID=151549 RepID=A0A4C1YAB9_EUMVA|nr:hypothetical protein EVAR_42034_1 [Eumeta japonica]
MPPLRRYYFASTDGRVKSLESNLQSLGGFLTNLKLGEKNYDKGSSARVDGYRSETNNVAVLMQNYRAGETENEVAMNTMMFDSFPNLKHLNIRFASTHGTPDAPPPSTTNSGSIAHPRDLFTITCGGRVVKSR